MGILVHKFNDGVNHCWLLGQRWIHIGTSDEVPYPLASPTPPHTPYQLLHCSLVESTKLCTHYCQGLTFQGVEFRNSIRDDTLLALCYAGKSIVHNPRFNVFIEQPNNSVI